MKLHLRSDIHLEVNKGYKQPDLPQGADVYVIAGDIEDHKYPERVAKENPDKQVVVVLGNHDYWYCPGPDAYRSKEVPNLHVLERQAIKIGDFKFIGCTLWGIGPCDQYDSRWMKRNLNDFHRIKDFSPWKMKDLNIQSRMWLENEINNDPNPQNIIVVTHFPPVMSSRQNPDRDLSNYLYYNGGVDMKAIKPVGLWLHGHTHEVNISDHTKPMSNALGYIGYEKTDFDKDLIIDIT